VRRGDLYWTDLIPRSGSKQKGRRPVILVSHNAFTSVPTWQSVIVVPLTTSSKARIGPTAIALSRGAGGLKQDSVALCHQVTTLDRGRLVERMGQIEKDDLRRIEAGLIVALDLEN